MFQNMSEQKAAKPGSAQTKIFAMLDNLQTTSQGVSNNQSSKCEQIKAFQRKMVEALSGLHQKLGSAVSVLDEVEQQASQVFVASKNKLKESTQMQQKIQDIQNEFNQTYESNKMSRQNMDRQLNSRMLELKLSVNEHQAREKHEIQYLASEYIPSKLKQFNATKQGEDPVKSNLLRMRSSINERLIRLKKQSSKADESIKPQLTKQKQVILKMCEDIQAKIVEEEQSIKQSFEFHLNTLEKIVASVTEKIN